MTKCSHCEKEAIYFRNYSGEKTCRKCYVKSIEKRVKKSISRYKMFKPDDKIAIAVSGGKDSLALLHILHRIEDAFPKSELVAITIDEGIAGYRTEAVDLAKKNCEKLKIEHHLAQFRDIFGYDLDDIVKISKKSSGPSACYYCGVLRRKALNKIAQKVGVNKLATAHNLDDETQTMLLNVIHGDIKRITRVGPVTKNSTPFFVKRVKPFYNILEREIAFYAYLKEITFQTVPCPYARAGLRSDTRNILNRLDVKHPGTKFTVLRAFEKIRDTMNDTIIKVELKNCKICSEASIHEVCRPCQILIDIGLTK